MINLVDLLIGFMYRFSELRCAFECPKLHIVYYYLHLCGVFDFTAATSRVWVPGVNVQYLVVHLMGGDRGVCAMNTTL